MAKDINIHIKTTGAAEAKQQIEGLSDSAKGLGVKIDEGQQVAGRGVEATTSKLSVMDRIFNRLRSQVVGFIAGWLGIQAVMKLVDYFIESLEKLKKIQEDIYQKSLPLGEIGQGLVVQLGAPGKQQYWTQQALKLQQAGALASPEVAAQMLVSMDVAFAKAGGIKAPGALNIAGQLAPFVGAMQLKPEQVQSIFGLAGQEGIEPTAAAYKKFFGEIYAASQMTKTRDFGQFVSQLSKDMETQEKERVEAEQRKGISPHKRKEILAAIQPTEAMKFRAAAKGAVFPEFGEYYPQKQRELDAAIAGEKVKYALEFSEKQRAIQKKTAEEDIQFITTPPRIGGYDVMMPFGFPIGKPSLPSNPPVTINYDNSTNYYPKVGDVDRGPRITSGVQP